MNKQLIPFVLIYLLPIKILTSNQNDGKNGQMNCSAWRYKPENKTDYYGFKFSYYRTLQSCINEHTYDTRQFLI